MAERGMPRHAKLLRDLLDEREQWKASASSYFVEVRNATGVSQTEFAKEIGISQPYLNQIEHGVRTPSSGTLDRLLTYVEGADGGDPDQAEEDKKGDEAEAS